MALLETRRAPPSPLNLRPIPTLLAIALSSGLFIVALAFVARATADGSVMPVQELPFVDAGPPLVAGDGGTFVESDEEPAFVDAGALYSASPDGGTEPIPPPSVDGPPFAASEVAAAAVVVVEQCAQEALRWDPSLGGPFALAVELPVGTPAVIVVDGLVSPVLSSCLTRRTSELALPASLLAAALEVPLAVRARASLAADGRITWSDAVVAPHGGVDKLPNAER